MQSVAAEIILAKFCIAFCLVFADPTFPEPICEDECEDGEVCRIEKLEIQCTCPPGVFDCGCPGSDYRPRCVRLSPCKTFHFIYVILIFDLQQLTFTSSTADDVNIDKWTTVTSQ